LFIDHVYSLPERLRDSLMVNRIRKALEFFEVRQNVADVGTLMSSQSAIDGSRIMGSYIIVRAFLWAIPLLGFIGTVIGLSHAISGMSFSNVEDVSKIVGSINNVTSGLGTAFDATLLGLVFAVVLNFPLNSLAKHEEEALNDIDAYCNEVLLPRLDDGAAGAATEEKEKTKHTTDFNDLGAVADAMVQALTGAQQQFLTHLDELSGRMLNYANSIEERNEQYQQAALQHLSDQMHVLNTNAQEHMALVRQQQDTALSSFAETVANLDQSTRSVYESMVQGHNTVVSQFTEKLDSISTGLDTALSTSVKVNEKAVSALGEHVGKLESASKEYHQSVKAAHEGAVKLLAEKVGDLSTGIEQSLKSTLDQTQKTVGSLESSMRSLNTILTDLGSKQVVVQQVKKKGWFSRGE
jgi:flagellar motor component MotA